MSFRFEKMHANCNDFVVLYETHFSSDEEISALAKQVCARRYSIGADGLVLLNKKSDRMYFMRIFNANGSEAETCGNALLCMGEYIYAYLGETASSVIISTLSGDKKLSKAYNDSFEVDMGHAKFTAKEVPFEYEKEKIIGEKIELLNKVYDFYAVSMGNPHAVLIATEDINVLNIEEIYEELLIRKIFPAGVNLEIVNINSYDEICMRVRERGVGETYSCGSGACAAAIAHMLSRGEIGNTIVKMRGGSVKIDWRAGGKVFMTGKASLIFSGEMHKNASNYRKI